mgnify:CR=1 FL=1
MKQKETYAFFDFDGTITDADTFKLFGIFVSGQTRFLSCVLKTMPWIMAWKAGIISNSKAKEKLFSALYRGLSYNEFRDAGERFADIIDCHLIPATMQRLRRHIADGHRVAIVSASMEEWIKPWASRNGIDTVLATAPQADDAGRITGRFLSPNCHGKEKVNRITRHFGPLSDADIYAYGDSSGDTPMWGIANHPFKVINNEIRNL